MATKALVIDAGTTKRVPDAETLVVGAGIDAATGTTLTIGGTTATSITLGSATIPVNIPGDVTTVGGTTFTTDATFEGNVTFGNANTDTVDFVAKVDSPIEFAAPGYKIENMLDPTAAQDAATKNYVDNEISGSVNVGNTFVAVGNGTGIAGSANLTWSGTDLDVTGAVNIKGGDPRALAVRDVGDTVDFLFVDAANEILTVQSSVSSSVVTIDGGSVNVSDASHTAQLAVVAGTSVNVDLYVPVASAVVPAIVAKDTASTAVPLKLDAQEVQVADGTDTLTLTGSSATSSAATLDIEAASSVTATITGGATYLLTPDTVQTITYAASVAVDFDPSLPQLKTVTLTGDIAFTSSNLGASRNVSVRVVGDTVSRNLTSFPAGWTWLGGAAPTVLEANKTAILSLASFSNDDANVVASWSYDGSDVVTDVTASGPLASSGGATPDISFPSWPANASGALTNDGAGNLSWAPSSGGTITGSGTATQIAYFTGASAIGSEAASGSNSFTWDATNNRLGVGTATPSHVVDVQAGSVASGVYALNVDATLVSGGGDRVSFIEGSVDSGVPTGTPIYGLVTGLNGAGIPAISYAGYFNTVLAGNGADPVSALQANFALRGSAFGTTALGHNVGVTGLAANGARNYGVLGNTTNDSTGANVAVTGMAKNNGGGVRIGGLFASQLTGASQPTVNTSAALIADNMDLGDPIFLARDAGTTTFTIADGGAVTAKNTTNSTAAFDVQNAAAASQLRVDTTNSKLFFAGVATTDTHTFNIGTSGTNPAFAIAAGGRIHRYDGNTPVDGDLLIGNGSAGNFAKTTLTAGSGISITNGAGTIEIAATAGTDYSVVTLTTAEAANTAVTVAGAAAIATAAATSRVAGIVTATNTVKVLGICTCDVEGSLSIAAGDAVYLSASEAGAVTNVAPSASGEVVAELGIATAASSGGTVAVLWQPKSITVL